jgi:two-component system, NtrC family, response regulator PilR
VHLTPPPHATPRLLVVDDEPDLRTLYELSLLKIGYQVESAADLASARALLAQNTYKLVITDMRLPDGLGLDLVKEINHLRRPEKTIVITAYGSAENAVEALKAGAFDYLTKPVEPKQLRTAVAAALSPDDAAGTATVQQAPSLGASQALARIVGDSAAMVQVRQRIERAAPSMAPVLVMGESGTGKELVARALHACSHRASGPFVAVNCGAIPEHLMEAEFFGVRKGAYTGATQDREGYFQAAQSGTLFLDELGDLPLPMQAKLLRAVQERHVRPLGSTQEEAVDVRIVSATHRNLAQAVQTGQFRQDLYYRLNVIEIELPPLRERLNDLPLVAQGILYRLAQRNGQPQAAQLDADALAALTAYHYPGNVRELENILERATALFHGPMLGAEAVLLPRQPLHATPAESPTRPTTSQENAVNDEAPFNRNELQQLLEQNRWNQSRTARQLGWTLSKLRYWMQRLGLGEPPG